MTNNYNLNVEENGPDINIHKKSSDRFLLIDITNVKSFNELNRIIHVLKSIIEMYDNYINDKLINRNKKYFESDDIIEYELNPESFLFTERRKMLWEYIYELIEDEYLNKYIIFN